MKEEENILSGPVQESTNISKVPIGSFRENKVPETEQKVHNDAETVYSNTGNINQTINNTTQLVEDSLTFERIVVDVPTHTSTFFNREKLCASIDKEMYQDNVNLLLEHQFIFIASDNKEKRDALAYYFFSKNFEKKCKLKQLYFENAKQETGYTLADMVQVLHEQESLFLISDMGSYLTNSSQQAFLESVSGQPHTNSIITLRTKNIFLLLLVSTAKGYSIASEQNANELQKHVWFLDEDKSDKSKAPAIETVFAQYNYIEKLVLFAAASFEDLTFRDFDFIMNLLIANATAKEKITLEFYKNFEDGAKKIKQVSDEDLTTVWNNNKDVFFNNCLLEAKGNGNVYVVAFKFPEQKSQVINYLRKNQHFFWQSQCALLEESRLVFNPSINESIAMGVINIIVDSLSDDMNYYNEFWFIDIIQDITYKDGQEYQIKGETPKEKLVSLFADMEDRRELIFFFYSRLGSILKKMYQRKDPKANDFLQSLITFGLHEQLLVMVKILSLVEEFNKFFWLKQLIERGNLETKSEAYRWIVDVSAIRYPDQTWQTFKSWMPAGKKISQYSPSNHYACFFIVHFYVNEICRLPFSDYGEWPSKFSFFMEHKDDPQKCEDHIRFVINQYLQEGTLYQFSNDNNVLLYQMSLEILALKWSEEKIIRKFLFIDDDNYLDNSCMHYTPDFYTLFADIIEACFHILTGFKQSVTEEIQALTDFFIKVVITQAKSVPEHFTKILKHWEKKAGEYNHQIKRLTEYLKNKKDGLENKEIAIWEDFSDSLKKRGENMISFFHEINKCLYD